MKKAKIKLKKLKLKKKGKKVSKKGRKEKGKAKKEKVKKKRNICDKRPCRNGGRCLPGNGNQFRCVSYSRVPWKIYNILCEVYFYQSKATTSF